MQRQKTIAKWLVIIVLVTVAVGAYIMYDALYLGGETADGGANTVPPTSDPDVTPDEDPPFFTTLPRHSQTYAGITVAHAGGEGEEEVLGTVLTQNTVYLFFSSSSDEYDCRGAGVYVAVFEQNSLIAVTRFAEKDCVFGGAKLTRDGVAAVVSEGGRGRLVVFDSAGKPKGETDIPAFSSAFPLVADGKLSLFLTGSAGLSFVSVEEGLSPVVSPFRFPTVCEVKEGFASGGSFTLAACDGTDTFILTFSQKAGFRCTETYDKSVFLQIIPIAGEDGAAFAMLAKQSSGVLLSVLSADGEELAAAVREGSSSAAVFGDGVSITLVRPGLTETYCRHLDLISSTPTDLRAGEIVAARSDSENNILALVSDGVTTVYAEDGYGNFIPLIDCAHAEGKTTAEIVGGTLVLVLSTSSADGVFFENFGASDAYLVSLPL